MLVGCDQIHLRGPTAVHVLDATVSSVCVFLCAGSSGQYILLLQVTGTRRDDDQVISERVCSTQSVALCPAASVVSLPAHTRVSNSIETGCAAASSQTCGRCVWQKTMPRTHAHLWRVPGASAWRATDTLLCAATPLLSPRNGCWLRCPTLLSRLLTL
jgi:hypothetical protein